MTLLYKLQ